MNTTTREATGRQGRDPDYDVALITRHEHLVAEFRRRWPDGLEVMHSVAQLLQHDTLRSTVYVVDSTVTDIELFQAAFQRYSDASHRTWYLLASHAPDPSYEELLPATLRILNREALASGDLIGLIRRETEGHGRQHIRSMRYLDESAGFAVRLGNGRAYFLPLGDLFEADSSDVINVVQGEDDSYYVATQASGNTFEIPWDDVLYHCEPTYEYYKHRAGSLEQDNLRIGQRIRGVRKRKGLTITALAERAGMKRPNLSRLERGKHRPSLDTLERIAEALGVPVAELVRNT